MTGDICILSLLFQYLEMLFTELIHPVFAFLKRKDYYFQPDSSLQTKSPRQGCIAPGFFISADKISSPGMHRPRDFSSLQTKSPRQGCIATGFFIPADKISPPGMHRHGIFHPCRQNLLARDASPPQLYPRFPSAPAVRRARLNSPQRLPGAPAPDKADSSDSQTAGFHSR